MRLDSQDFEKVQVWTRIGTTDDFHDVVESYEEVKNIISNAREFAEFMSVTGYRISILTTSILAFYEHGIDIMRKCWKRTEQLGDLQKEDAKPDWA